MLTVLILCLTSVECPWKRPTRFWKLLIKVERNLIPNPSPLVPVYVRRSGQMVHRVPKILLPLPRKSRRRAHMRLPSPRPPMPSGLQPILICLLHRQRLRKNSSMLQQHRHHLIQRPQRPQRPLECVRQKLTVQRNLHRMLSTIRLLTFHTSNTTSRPSNQACRSNLFRSPARHTQYPSSSLCR